MDSSMQTSAGLGTVLMRGLRRKCPNCGKGASFKSYLKVVDTCSECQTPLGNYPCDDGPAYVTMILVGHLVIAPLLMMSFFWDYPPSIVVPTLLVSIGIMTLVILPFVKGAFLNLLWHLGIKSNARQ